MRFAPEVIDVSSSAIDLLKRRYGADNILIVGYSGGGAVAALVAASRHDVIGLVTVAGNLDHQALTTFHRIAPLTGSLNAADAANRLGSIQQWLFVGGKDKNNTPEVTQSYMARFHENQRPKVYPEPDFDHRCCWVEKWPDLWGRVQIPE